MRQALNKYNSSSNVPRKSQFLIEAFQDATKEAHGYLLIDLKPSTEDNIRVNSTPTN